MTNTVIDDELGNLDEFKKQVEICEKLGLQIVGPVYKSWRPLSKVNKKTLASPHLKDISTISILRAAISFIQNYDEVTVRQIYYGLVSQQIINNNINEYIRVVEIIKRGRLAGLIDFNKVIDDTRGAEKTSSWNRIETILNAAITHFRSDWWADQVQYIEVWLEKRALRRIFYPITNYYDVYLCVGGGYQSWSEVWEAKVKRFEKRKGKELIILYFGDLDPSGKDMPRDIKKRFDDLGIKVDVKEIALTRFDVQQYNLPKNPTKSKDTRNKSYIQKYGINYGVELDALPPDVLRDILRKAIRDHTDVDRLLEKKSSDEENKDYWRHIVLSYSI